MHVLSLLTAAAVIASGPALAGTIQAAGDFTTDKANDLRGLTFAANGKIYASGHLGTANDKLQTVVTRFNADGKPDTSFGGDGFVEFDLAPGRLEQSLAVAALTGGDVIVAVNAGDADGGQSVYLIRLDSTGARKVAPAWGDADGKVEVVFGWANSENEGYPDPKTPPSDTSWDLLVDRTGGSERLVLFGLGSAAKGTGRTDADRYVVRLNTADGKPDATFNDGKPFAYHSAGNVVDNARRGLIEADGSILSAGYSPLGSLGAHVVLFRLLPNGTLDTSFGGFVEPASSGTAVGLTARPGVAVFNPLAKDGGFAEAYGVAKLGDGSYVTSGYGAATGKDIASTLGFATTLGPDLVTFRMKGNAVDKTWGKAGVQAIQSEGKGKPTNEERGRHIIGLSGDRTLQVGRYGGVPAVYVFNAKGQLVGSPGTELEFAL